MHRVNRIELELTFTKAERAQGTLGGIGGFSRRLSPIVDRVCCELDASADVLRLDRVEVDLGTLAADDVEAVLIERLEPALRAAMGAAVARQGRIDEGPGVASLQLVETFALTGSFPWWADPQDDLSVARHFARAAVEAPARLTTLLKSLRNDPGAIRRLERSCGLGAAAALNAPDSDFRVEVAAVGEPAGMAGASDATQMAAGPSLEVSQDALLSAGARSLNAPRASSGAVPRGNVPSSSGEREPSEPGVDAAWAIGPSLEAPRAPSPLGDAVPWPKPSDARMHAARTEDRAPLDGAWGPTPSSLVHASTETRAADTLSPAPAPPRKGRLPDPSPPGALPRDPSPPGALPRDPSPPGASPRDPSPPGASPRDPSPPGASPRDPSSPGASPRDPSPRGASPQSALPPEKGASPPDREPAAPDEEVQRVRRRALARLDEVYIDEGGLVLLWPFLHRFLVRAELVEPDGVFRREAAQQQAVAMVSALATGAPEPHEAGLALAKLLCGRPVESDVSLMQPLSTAQLAEGDRLLSAVLDHAPRLSVRSVDDFRTTFLQRRCALTTRDGAWLLQVEQRVQDAALVDIPWSWTWVRLPWMTHPMRVQW